MHINPAILFGSATVLLVATSASAEGPLTLSDFQLDGVTPLAQYSPAELFQLRIAIDSATDDEPDRARDAIVQEELETDGLGMASGDQSMTLAATSQSATEVTAAPEPAPASTSRNTPATWTGGKYGASSERSVAPEPTRWTGGTYGASSPRIPAPRPMLGSTSRNQPSAWSGGTQSTSTISSSRSPSRARVAITAPNRAWGSENLSMPRAPRPALASTSRKQPEAWAGGTQMPRTVRSASTDESSLRGRSASAAQLASVAPRLGDMIVKMRSEAKRMLRGLPNGNRSFSMRP